MDFFSTEVKPMKINIKHSENNMLKKILFDLSCINFLKVITAKLKKIVTYDIFCYKEMCYLINLPFLLVPMCLFLNEGQTNSRTNPLRTAMRMEARLLKREENTTLIK